MPRPADDAAARPCPRRGSAAAARPIACARGRRRAASRRCRSPRPRAAVTADCSANTVVTIAIIMTSSDSSASTPVPPTIPAADGPASAIRSVIASTTDPNSSAVSTTVRRPADDRTALQTQRQTERSAVPGGCPGRSWPLGQQPGAEVAPRLEPGRDGEEHERQRARACRTATSGSRPTAASPAPSRRVTPRSGVRRRGRRPCAARRRRRGRSSRARSPRGTSRRPARRPHRPRGRRGRRR